MHLVIQTDTHLESSQLFTGVSCLVIHLGQTDVQVSQPESKLVPLCLKPLPL